METKCPLVVFTGEEPLITILIQITPVKILGRSHPLWCAQ